MRPGVLPRTEPFPDFIREISLAIERALARPASTPHQGGRAYRGEQAARRFRGGNGSPFLDRNVQVFIRRFIKDATLHHLVRCLFSPVHYLLRVGIELVFRAVVVSPDVFDRSSLRHAHRLCQHIDALPVEIVSRHIVQGRS